MNPDKAMPTDPDNARLADRLDTQRRQLLTVHLPNIRPGLTLFSKHREDLYNAAYSVAATVDLLEEAAKALRSQQVRAVPGGAFAHELREQSRYPSGQPRISLETAKSVVAAALSTQPDDEFIHRAPTSVDPSLEGPGVVPDDVKAMIEELREGISIAPRIDECVAASKTMAEAATMLETLCAETGRAVAVEREECAKMAEGYVDPSLAENRDTTIAATSARAAIDIAAAIRARSLAGEGE